MLQWSRKNLMLFILFLCITLLLRAFSFYPLVLDHDESTYLVIAKALTEGKIYLTEVIDTKPIGIFWIYAAVFKVFGNSIFATRILACVVIAASSLLIYHLQWKWTLHKTAALCSGLLYILMLSVFKRWGLSPNTEIYFNLFNLLAIYFALVYKVRFFDVLAGICIGTAFHIKYVAAAESAALVGYLCLNSIREKQFIKFVTRRLLWFFIGFLIPTGLILNYYISHSAFDEFIYYTFRVTGNYSSSFDFVQTLRFIGDYFFRYLPITILLILCFRTSEFQLHAHRLFLILWFVLDLCIIVVPGKYFEHYFIQFIPVCSIIAGYFFSTPNGSKLNEIFATSKSKIAAALLVSLILFAHFNSFIKKPETIRETYRWLENQLKPDDIIYTSNANHILYFLLDKESPSPYIHSSLIWNDKHRRTLQLNGLSEIENILTKYPDYIIWNETDKDLEMQNRLLREYHKFHVINERSFIYQRNGYDPK